MKIVLIGAGNVAFHLGPLLKSKGHQIIQLYSRSKKTGLKLSGKLKCSLVNDPKKLNSEADIYIIALRDEVITSFVKNIPFIPNLIVHTSGSSGLDVFPARMKNTGVIYPLQTFSKSIKISPKKIPFLIEAGNRKDLVKIRKLAKSISPVVYELSSYDRELIHLSAVFVNNFTNHLFTLAEKLLQLRKIPFDILRPLIMETVQKIQSDNPKKTQTGPARRGDSAIIMKHLKMLKDFPQMKVIYKQISNSIRDEYEY
jgi:predicted short-subunit dehydrogenase-like oxidoreductase (DUF2520 family)